MKPIKVLEVIRQGDVGGGESHVIDLVLGFQRAKVDAVVMAFTSGKMIDLLQAAGIKCYVIPTQRPFDHRIQKEIRNIILNEGIQLIHAHGSRAASNVFWTARQMKLPLVYTVHGWSFHQDQHPFIYRLRIWSEKFICHYADKVICVSESNRLSGEKAFGLGRKAEVIENGINLTRFDADAQYPDVRAELGIKKEDFVIGLIARITLQKGPMNFVKSIQKAHSKDQRIKGLIVGDGDMKEEVLTYIRQQQIENLFYICPFRSDIPAVLHAIDVYCLPSLWEGLSIALIEAMAMKKALVVTPTDGTKEIIRENKNGLVVDFDDDGALANAYIYYLNHPDDGKAFGEAAHAIVQERFDSQRVSESVTRIYFEEMEQRKSLKQP